MGLAVTHSTAEALKTYILGQPEEEKKEMAADAKIVEHVDKELLNNNRLQDIYHKMIAIADSLAS